MPPKLRTGCVPQSSVYFGGGVGCSSSGNERKGLTQSPQRKSPGAHRENGSGGAR